MEGAHGMTIPVNGGVELRALNDYTRMFINEEDEEENEEMDSSV